MVSPQKLRAHTAHLHKGSLAAQTRSRFVSDAFYKREEQAQFTQRLAGHGQAGPAQDVPSKKNLLRRGLLSPVTALPHPEPLLSEQKSQFLLRCLVLVTQTKANSALGTQSCPAAKDNSQQHYLPFAGLMLICAGREGGGSVSKDKISR